MNNVAIDGDGTHWVAAWSNQGPGTSDIFACTLSYADSTGLTATAPMPIAVTAISEGHPAVMRTGGSALIGWTANLSNPIDVNVRSVDPFGCAACENAVALGGANLQNNSLSGCSTASGAGGPDDALLVWVSTGTNGEIQGRLWRSADGVVTSLGGGCGLGGSAQANCARVPNQSFAHRLRDAVPNSATFLIQSLGQETGACGPCTRIPALAGAVTLFTLVDGLGNAELSARIPNNPSLRGLVQFDQWLTLRTGGACTQFQVDMSNALRIVIE